MDFGLTLCRTGGMPLISWGVAAGTVLRQLDRGFRDRLRRDPSWFRPTLFGVVALGAIVRIAFAISVMSRVLSGDAHFFHTTAAQIANGKGYPTAAHPPVFPYLLAVFDLVGISSVGAQRIAVSIVASAGVLLVGLLGRKVAGPIVGIVAALIAATDPLWFQPGAVLMSESIYLVAIPGMLLMALLCIEKPSVLRFGGLGLLIAIATLIRSEAVDFIALLGLPVVLMAVGDWRRRIRTGVALVAGFALVITPWLVKNEIQLGGATLSTNGGGTLAGSYCAATFNPSDSAYGSYDGACSLIAIYDLVHYTRPPNGAKHFTELELDHGATRVAETFARNHLSDLPGVVVARELSVWGFGNQEYQLGLASYEGRVQTYEQAGRVLYWVLLPFVILGILVLARTSRRRFVVTAIPIAVVAVNSAVFYGSTRMRMAAEPSLAVLASIGLVAAACLAIDSMQHSKFV
jgi:4-amino-4-deoxy-L-arabinose transferase-like glycosyltransferase